MLTLKNKEFGTELILKVVDYQFPNNTNNNWHDDNWCMISAKVTQRENLFEVTDPALETIDLQQLLKWFQCLSNRILPQYATLDFIEPCLSFEFIKSEKDWVRISIKLDYEMKPNFLLEQFLSLDDEDTIDNCDFEMIFDLTQDDFSAVIASLQETIKNFPIRNNFQY